MAVSPAVPEVGPRALAVITFIEAFLCLEDGSPFLLQRWEKDFLTAFYSAGVTRGLLSVAKKNGKTQLAAALALAHVLGPEKLRGGRVVSAAAGSKEQAGFVFQRAHAMVLASAKLHMRCRITVSKMRLEHQLALSRYEALPAKARTVQGELPAFWIYDEYAQALDSDLYDALDRGQGTFAGDVGRGLVISTRSHRPANPMADLADGIERGHKMGLMQHWVSHVYSGDPDAADEFTLENVALANPGLELGEAKSASTTKPEPDGFLSRASVLREIEEAKLMPSKRAAFRAYRLNIESEPTDSLLDMALWGERADPECGDAFARMCRLWLDLVDEVCVLGLDMSASQDLTSIAMWFPRRHFLAVRSYLPIEILAARELDDRVPYREWHAAGDLLVTPGETIEPRFIGEEIGRICGRFQVRELRYDRWRSAVVRRRLEEVGASVEMRDFGQGYKDMGPAVEDFERLIINGKLRHDDNPVTNYGMGACLVTTDSSSTSEARKPLKRRGARNDPAIAALMAVADMGLDTRERTAADYVPIGFYDDDEDGD